MMKVLCTRLLCCRSGATSTECGLVAALISIVLFSSAGNVGETLGGQFATISAKIGSASAGATQSARSKKLVLAGPFAATPASVSHSPSPP